MLRALNALTGAGLSPEKLAALSLPLGADVPYCVLGGTMLAEGVGERLTALPALPDCAILLCKPDFPSPTGAVFAAYDAAPPQSCTRTADLLPALEKRSLPDIAARCANALEPVVAAAHPEIAEIRRTLTACGALGSMMTGSGSAVCGIFPDDTAAQPALEALRTRYAQTFLAHPM